MAIHQILWATQNTPSKTWRPSITSRESPNTGKPRVWAAATGSTISSANIKSNSSTTAFPSNKETSFFRRKSQLYPPASLATCKLGAWLMFNVYKLTTESKGKPKMSNNLILQNISLEYQFNMLKNKYLQVKKIRMQDSNNNKSRVSSVNCQKRS